MLEDATAICAHQAAETRAARLGTPPGHSRTFTTVTRRQMRHGHLQLGAPRGAPHVHPGAVANPIIE